MLMDYVSRVGNEIGLSRIRLMFVSIPLIIGVLYQPNNVRLSISGLTIAAKVVESQWGIVNLWLIHPHKRHKFNPI